MTYIVIVKIVYKKFANNMLNFSACGVLSSWSEYIAGLGVVTHSLRKDYPTHKLGNSERK